MDEEIGADASVQRSSTPSEREPDRALGRVVRRLPSLAWSGGLFHAVSGEPLEHAVVIVGAGGTVEWVGPADEATFPDGVEMPEAVVVTLGLIDADSVVGLAGALASNVGPVRDRDQLDVSVPDPARAPRDRRLDATERLVEWVRRYGVTTLHTGHAPAP